MQNPGNMPVGPALTLSADRELTVSGMPSPSGAQFARLWARLDGPMPELGLSSDVDDAVTTRRHGASDSEGATEAHSSKPRTESGVDAFGAGVGRIAAGAQPGGPAGDRSEAGARGKMVDALTEEATVVVSTLAPEPRRAGVPFWLSEQSLSVNGEPDTSAGARGPGAARFRLADSQSVEPELDAAGSVVRAGDPDAFTLAHPSDQDHPQPMIMDNLAVSEIPPAVAAKPDLSAWSGPGPIGRQTAADPVRAESLSVGPKRMTTEPSDRKVEHVLDRAAGPVVPREAVGATNVGLQEAAQGIGRADPGLYLSGNALKNTAETNLPLFTVPVDSPPATGLRHGLAIHASQAVAELEPTQSDGFDHLTVEQTRRHDAKPESGLGGTRIHPSEPAGDVAPTQQSVRSAAPDLPRASVSQVSETMAAKEPQANQPAPSLPLPGRVVHDEAGQASTTLESIRAKQSVGADAAPSSAAFDVEESRRLMEPVGPDRENYLLSVQETPMTSEMSHARETDKTPLILSKDRGHIPQTTSYAVISPKNAGSWDHRTTRPGRESVRSELLERSVGHPGFAQLTPAPADGGTAVGGLTTALPKPAMPGHGANSTRSRDDTMGSVTFASRSTTGALEWGEADHMVAARGSIDHRTGGSMHSQVPAALFAPGIAPDIGPTLAPHFEIGRTRDLSTPRSVQDASFLTLAAGQPGDQMPLHPSQAMRSTVWRLDPGRPEIQPFDVSLQTVVPTELRNAAAPVATTPASAAAMPAAVVVQQLIQVSGQLARGPIEVSLSPEELGRVRMTLGPCENGMVLSIMADRDDTLALLRRNADILSSDLRDLGYANLSFHFGSGGAGDGSRDRGRDPQNNGLGAERNESTTVTSQSQSAARLSADRLDLRL